EGSTISGLMDAFATAVSVALQYGVPLKDLVNKFSHLRFEPAGFTTNRDIPMAKSLIDYIFRYLATKFLSRDEQDVVGIINRQMTLSDASAVTADAPADTSTTRGSATLAAEASAAASPSSVQASGQDALATDEATASSSSTAEVAQAAPDSVPGILDGLKVVASNGHAAAREERLEKGQPTVIFDTADSPACSDCGSIMVRNGSCYKCLNCGSTSGCS
ncbi:MAG: vitamin B12-dependent ribonucleotide reductase, partial [Gemmatimonadales bacterium]